MNALAAVIAIAACSTLHNPMHASFASGQQSSQDLEKRAVAITQQIPVQALDPELPKTPFATWFKQAIGPGAEVIWQLSECGELAEAADIRACVEANTIVPDGRQVIVMVAVGTFKKGLAGAPAFQFGVIVRDEELYLIRRLRDLPRQLSAPSVSLAHRPAVKLPQVDMPEVRLAANDALAVLPGAWSDSELTIEEPPPAEPRRAKEVSTAENKSVAAGLLQGRAIVKAQPTYPRNAKRFNASGPVEVRVTISETGSVIDAKAISGHPLLREAATEAARKWVFKPTTINGVPVETQLVLTFEFTVPQYD
jgi:TonB family protein